MMDGAFVPNLSYGPAIVELARKTTRLPLSVHLMFVRPDLYAKRFAEAGATTLQIHVESSCEVGATLEAIRRFGAEPALVLNPLTPHTAALPYLHLVDECLQMTSSGLWRPEVHAGRSRRAASAARPPASGSPSWSWRHRPHTIIPPARRPAPTSSSPVPLLEVRWPPRSPLRQSPPTRAASVRRELCHSHFIFLGHSLLRPHFLGYSCRLNGIVLMVHD